LAWSDGSPTGSLTLMSFCRTRCGRGGRMSCWGRKRGSSLSSLQARGSLGVDVPADDVVDRWSRRPRCGRLPASFAPSPRRRWFDTGKQGVSLGRNGLDRSKRKEGENEVLMCATLTLQAKHRARCGRGGEKPGGQRPGWHILSNTLCVALGTRSAADRDLHGMDTARRPVAQAVKIV
jgi:hypothetical protein